MSLHPAVERAATTVTPQTRHQRAVREFWERIDGIDLLLGMLLIFNSYTLAGNLPVGIPLAAAIIGVGCCRHAQVKVNSGALMVCAALVVFGYLVLVSVQQGQPWEQRTARFVLILGVAVVLAQRRIDPRSLILGGCIGASLNALAFYAGLTSNNYPPYLTGFYGDKNVAGLFYAVWGVLGVAVLSRRWAVGWLTISLVLVFLTGSRTSISAFLLGLAWLGLRNRVGLPLRVVLIGAGTWVLFLAEESFSRIGIFADRADTDSFRTQIDQATQVKVDAAPWTGSGLNQGFVMLGQVRRVWMHNSYAQAFIEGGLIFLAATIVAFAILALGPLSRARTVSRERLAAEAAVVVVLVCSWKIGESFMTTAAFVVLGIAIGARFGRPMTKADRWWAS